MLKLKIVKTDKYSNYFLKDDKGKEYEVNINFMNMDKPKLGSYIYINESSINENVSLNYEVVEKYDIKDEDESIILIIDNKKIYLERRYG